MPSITTGSVALTGTVVSLNAIEDGSLAQPSPAPAAQRPVSESGFLSLLRERISSRRRQLAAVGVLLVIGGLSFSDPGANRNEPDAVDFTEVEQMLSDFDTASGSQQPLREPAEPIETSAWDSMTDRHAVTRATEAAGATATAAAQVSTAPFTLTEPDSPSAMLNPSVTASSTATSSATAPAAGARSARGVRFSGRIQPLN